jgi:hypothetical protein
MEAAPFQGICAGAVLRKLCVVGKQTDRHQAALRTAASVRMRIGALAVGLAVLGAAGSAAARVNGSSRWPPQKYCFTGWMSAGVGDAPHHAFVEGDAVVFRFQDASNDRPTRYRVCWARVDGTNRRCWSRVARSFRTSSIATGGPLLHFGSYVARWYVGGRLVASWAFLFSPESSNHP